MGLREKVTITLVIIALIQIACIHCMPRTPRKASLKRYQDVLKPVKNKPVPTPYSPARVNKPPKRTFGKTSQNGRISQNSLPTKSLYQTYNFPENEYPLDNSPRDPFRIAMNFKDNNHVNTLQKARNLQSSAISDLKKEMKMKRKLLGNKQVNNENTQLKTDMSSIKSTLNPEPIRLLDSETFPEVQYPLNTMDTWAPNYWNYLPFTQEKPCHRFEQQTFNPKANEDIIKPFTKLTKAKASKYLQSYDKLKEHRSITTENSKRSNVGQKGLNFTKTATCERVSEDFITAGLVSNISSNSTETKKALTSSTKTTTSSENTCPVTEYPYHPMPIPYKVIEENTENICPAHEPKNKTKELQDVDNSVVDQTLQLIQEILFNDDTSSTVLPGNCSKEIGKNMNTSDHTVVSANEDISTTLMDSAKSCTVSPTEELSQEVSDDAPVVNLRNNMTSYPAELIPENTTAAVSLNDRMPLPVSEPKTYEALTNGLNPGPTPLPNITAVPGSTSIIIIPFNNNAVGKSQSHMFGTSLDTPIIVYLPSTQSSDNLSQPSPFNQIVFSSIDKRVPNNQLNVHSNMAPLQIDNLFSTALVSELLNSNSDSGSSLPIHETLPTNSMCYNESSPSSMREKPVSYILIDKSLTDDAPFITTPCDDKLTEKLTKASELLHVNTDTLPPISDFEHPLFDFSSSDFTSLSYEPYNNILHKELPIIAREIDSDQQILSVSSKDLFIPTKNVTSEHLHNTTSIHSVSEDSLPEIPNDVPPVALDKNFSSVTPTDSIETLNTNTLLSEFIPNLQEPVDTLTESLPQPIDKILLSTPLIETSTTKLPQPKESSRSPTLFSETLSDKLPIITNTKLPLTPVSDNTTANVLQYVGNTPSPPNLNSSSMMTDMTLKTELYKIRQILDKMLSTEITTYNQPPSIETTLLPVSDSDSLVLPMNEAPTDILPVPAVDKTLLPLPATDNSFDSLRQVHETLPLISVDRTPTDNLCFRGNKLVISHKLLETDTLSLPIDETVPPTLVSETSADNKPYLLDSLGTLLSETVTSRTENTPDSLSHKMNDLPLKMDLKFPYIYEACSNDLPLSVDDLPTKVHPENTTDPGHSTNDLPMQVVESLTPVSEVPVSDFPKPTDELSMPVDGLLEGVSSDVPMDSVKTLKSGSTDKLVNDLPSSKVPSDSLMMPRLPMNVLKWPIHETLPDGQNLLDNLVTPLSETVTLRTKNTPDKGWLHKMDDSPLKIDVKFPDIYEACSDDLPLSIDNLPTKVHSEHRTDSRVSTNDLPKQVFETLTPVSEVPVSNFPKPTDELSMPVDKVLEGASPDVPMDSVKTLKSGSTDKLLQNSLSSKVPSDDLMMPRLPMNVFKWPIHETLPDGQNLLDNLVTSLSETVTSRTKNTPDNGWFHKMDDLPLKIDVKDHLPISVQKFIPDSSLSDAVTNEPFLKDYSPSLVIDKNIEFPYSTADTKYLPLVVEHLLSPENYAILYSLVAGIPSAVSLSTNLEGLQSTNLDKTIDELVSESTLSDLPRDDLPLPQDKMLSLTDHTPNHISLPINKTPSISKLPITKALLENVLSDTTKGDLSSLVAKDLPVTPHSLLDKTLHYVDVKSPLSETKDIPLGPVQKISPSSEHIDNLINYVPFSKKPKDTSITDLLFELPLSMDEMHKDKPYFPTDDVEDNDNNEIQSLENSTHDLPVSIDKVSPSKDNTKRPSSSNLPITKALLENVLTDITTRDFTAPVAQSLRVTSPSMLDKTIYYIESPISHITENRHSQPVDKILLNTSLSDYSTDNVPILTEHTLPLPIDKTFSELQRFDIPTELSSPIDNIRPDIPVISTYAKEKYEIENPSSENFTDDLSSPSPMEGILSLSKDIPSDLPNIKTPSSSKLPITKALLENVLSDINTRGFSLPVAEALPAAPRSQLIKTVYFLESPDSDMTEKSSVIDDIPIISAYAKEQDEIENPSSESFTDDLSSAPPMEGILSLSKDTSSDLPNIKTPSSSKLPITKALLENVLSDINTRVFSLPVAEALPVAPHSQLDKTLNFLESPVFDMTEKSSVIDIPIISTYGKEQDEIENPFSEHFTDDLSSASPMDGILSLSKDIPSDLPNIKTPSSSKLPITKALLENVLSDINTRGFSLPVAEALPAAPRSQLIKTVYFLESPDSDMTEKSSGIDEPIISTYGKKQDEIENLFSEHFTDDHSSASPMEGSLSLSKDIQSDLPNVKTPSSSKLPITKALLENVLSDINTRGFSLPVAEALPAAPRSQLIKTVYFLESPDSDMTEKSSVIDDIPIISAYAKEQDEIENPSSESFTDDLSSAPPMEGILSLSKDTSSDLPNIKTPSSSKLPITKALLENVLSDINTRGFSLPVAEALPAAPRSQLIKTVYFLESPDSDMTEKSSVIDDIPTISAYAIEQDEIENPSSESFTDDLSSASPMEGILSLSKDTSSDLPNIKIPSSSKLPITKALLESVLSDINTRGFSLPVAEALPVAPHSQLDKTLNFLEYPVSDMTEKSSVIDIPIILTYGKEQDEIENPFFEHFTDDLSSASPMEGSLSLSKDIPSDLPNIKTPSSSKLPITKAFLENVLSDINARVSSLPVAEALPVAPHSQLDKTLNFLESPVSDMTEKSSVIDIPIISTYGKEQDEIENPFSEHFTDDLSSASPMDGILSLSKDIPSDLPNIKTPSSSKLPITKALLENVLSDINTRGFPLPVAEALPAAPRSQLIKTVYFLESPDSDMTEKSSVIDDIPIISAYAKEQDEIENPSSESFTDDLSSAPPIEGILSLSKDTSSDLPNIKTPSSSKLPITKALLENVLSDINTRGFSLPVAEPLPAAPRSQLIKTVYFLESPDSDMTEKSSVIDDIPTISAYAIEQDEIENPSSESFTDDLSSASPMEGILSLSKDTSSDLPNIKTPSSSKLPITKALLESVLSDINTRGFSLPVAEALPAAPRSQLIKTVYFLESPDSDMTEKSSVIDDIPIISTYAKEQHEIQNPSSESFSDDLSSASPMEGILSLSKDTSSDLPNIKTPSSSKLPITKALLENVLSDINTRGFSLPVAEALPAAPRSKLIKTVNFLEYPDSDMTEKSSVIDDIPIISAYGKEQDEIENPSSESFTDDLSSASPMEGILSLSKDTSSDLPNIKTPSSSKLPITKALLENVLSDINTRGFSLPVAEALPAAPRSQLIKTVYFLESPDSDMTEKSSVIDDIPIISAYAKEQDEIENPSSESFTDDLLSAPPMEGVLSLSKDTSSDLPNIKTPSSSKLPITKALLENVLSDINTRGFSLPVAEALPAAPRSQLIKTVYFLESPDSDMTEKSSVIDDIPIISAYAKEQDEIENPSSESFTDDLSSASPMEGILSLSKDTSSDLPNIKTPSSSKLPITKALLESVLSDINTRGFSLPVAEALPAAPRSQLIKTVYFLESPDSDMTEKSSVIDDIPIISTYGKKQDEIENLFSEHFTDDLSSASPMEGILSLSKDVQSDLPNVKTPSSSKLPITKALLENVLSDINTRGFSLPVAEALPAAPRSQLIKTVYFLESPDSDMTEKSSVIDDIPIISAYAKEQDEIENPSSESFTDDLSSAPPMEGILSLSKDTSSDLPNIKTPSSSKLPITKALLENVLSDINARGSSLPVAEALPVAPHSLLDKTLNFLESPVSDMTEKSSDIDIPIILTYGTEQDEIENPFSEHFTDDLLSASPMEGILSLSKDIPSDLQNVKTPSSSKLPITKALLENVLSDINTRGSSLPVAEALPVAPNHQNLHFLESPDSDMTEKSSVIDIPIISTYGKEQDEIESPFSENFTDDLSSASPIERILSLSKDTSSDLPNIKTPSSSKLPITKALLENVLSDINTRGFSLPVAKDLPVALHSQLDTLNYLQSPVSDMSEKSVIDDIPIISTYAKEQDKIENPSSETFTDDLSSASPMEGILSLSKDTSSDLPNIKTPSSSKLPITKALLENILSDINARGSSLPVAEALPVATRSQSVKTLYFLESPDSDMAEKSSGIDVPIISTYGKEQDEIENPFPEHFTDDLLSASPMEGILSRSKDIPSDLPNIKTPSSSKLPITKALLENVLSDINTRGFSLPIAEALPVAPHSQLDKSLNFLESPVSDMTEKSFVIDIPIISTYGKEQDEIENPFFEHFTDDLSSASPMEGILSLSKDIPSDLPNIKTPSSSKLPITKALLENVLSDINTRGSSLPVAEALSVVPRSKLNKTPNFLESPGSSMTEKSSVIDDIPIISAYAKEQDEIENLSSETFTDDLSSASPMEGTLPLSIDTSRDLPNIETPSSSKLPITKALLENVLSDINARGFSLPVAKALSVVPRSQLNKTPNFLESPVFDMTEKSSVIDIPVISTHGKEQDETENPSSGNLTDDLSSASPMEGILTRAKDIPSDLPNIKTPSSSKLPITKALLENVLSDINTRGFSLPVANAS